MSMKTYSAAGVDIERGERIVDFIRSLKSPAVSGGIGGFSAAMPLDAKAYTSPVLLTCADGVGTKILVAKALGKFDTIGIDLVAMSANDLAVSGAKPTLFLDYIACGKIQAPVLEDILRGIVKGCELAGCRLAGGETAEMPDLYQEQDFDLAGFCVGLAEKADLLPRLGEIHQGDVIFGVPSSGIHSNGFSLARKVLPIEIWHELLTPTRVYVQTLLDIREHVRVLSAAHITGGGLAANVDRVLPDHLRGSFTFSWEQPAVFHEIQSRGEISEEEMRKTFNLGVGLAIVVHESQRPPLLEFAEQKDLPLIEIGVVERR
jgi:phosphoribosylformylglycinamidine cyclo-ligase